MSPKESFEYFPTLTGHVTQMYSNPSPLVYVKNQSVVIIQSEEGVHQGDPMGPALFAALIHPLLADLQENHPNTTILAYLDDIYVIQTSTCCLLAFGDIKISLKQVNLSVCNHKCKLYYRRELSSQVRSDIPVVTKGMDILGTSPGCPEYIESRCVETSKSGQALCNMVTKLHGTQSELLLLRICHVPAINHLARSVIPSCLQPAAKVHNSLTKSTFCNILNMATIDE